MKRLIALVLLIASIIWSCKKLSFDPGSNAPEGKVKTNITGIVVDENGVFVEGAKIEIGTRATTTNEDGQFNFADLTVERDRFYIKASKKDYFEGGSGAIPVENGVSSVSITLLKLTDAKVIDPSTSNDVVVEGAKVKFQPNSFEPVSGGGAISGQVSVQAKLLTPDQDNFVNNIPGGDLLAIDRDSNQVALESYGMIGVELTENGTNRKLKLKDGTTATIEIPIAPLQRSQAPDTIPLWSFDAANGIWRQEGVAKKSSDGAIYECVVKHFSWWNCDRPRFMATISGKVVDCNGNPVPNARVYVTPPGWYKWCYRVTDQNGKYSALLPIFSSVNFSVEIDGQEVQLAKPVSLSNIRARGNYNIEDLKLSNCSKVTIVKGRVINCTNDIPAFYVRVFWESTPNSGVFNQGTAPSIVFNNSASNNLDATFTISVPSNKPLKIKVATAGYDTSRVIDAIQRGGTFDFGTYQFCVRRPTLTTNAVTSIDTTSAISGGEIANPSQIKIKERGVCWGTSSKPTIALPNKRTNDGIGFGKFTSQLTGLKPNTKYFVRAYAVANAGATFYGNEQTFTTPAQ